jgi:N-acetylglucosaminyl-diphospho-decaprenol L-rhamnosyltransferase
MPDVDIVIVTYNSADKIDACLSGLAGEPDLRVTVVDNASSDATVAALESLPIELLPQRANRGFAVGCNVGWRSGRAPYVLFLNPDAVIDARSVRTLVDVVERDETVGIAAPKFLYPDGSLAPYLRRFPSLSSTFGRALFLHRLFPRARRLEEVVADESAYEQAGRHDWVPGACLLLRRSLLERLDGFDERYFMYCEDKDLCKRAAEIGLVVWYEPQAVCVHESGASRPRSSLLPVLATSRRRYAERHESGPVAALHRLGLVLETLTRLVLARGGAAARAGHARALLSLVRPLHGN